MKQIRLRTVALASTVVGLAVWFVAAAPIDFGF